MQTDLKSRIETIIAECDAQFGVALRHIETGQEVMIDADSLYTLASVVKVPILVETFRRLGQDHLRLDDRWTLNQADKNLGSGILTFLDNGLTPTVRDLITLMIIISDNTATDMLMTRLGLDAIDRTIHAAGLENIHVALTLKEIFADMLPSADPAQDRDQLADWENQHGVNKTGVAYHLGPDNNVASPRDMTRLVEMIFKGEILDRGSCDGMLEILLTQQLNDRLPRLLPAGTKFAHKTGTFSGVRNDTGILYAGEESHVAMTVFARWDYDAVRKDPARSWERFIQLDTAFGLIGLAAYDAFAG